MNRYIHFGDDIFYPEKCIIEKETVPSKPTKGLWASPTNSYWGWKEWCKSEHWKPRGFDWSKYFEFTVSANANILCIHNEEDIMNYIIPDMQIRGLGFTPYGLTCITDKLDTDRLYKDFDGIELFMSGNREILYSGIFNSWDCDSIVIWNPDIIQL